MSEGKVITFPGQTLNEIDPQAVLSAAKEASLDCVLIMGVTPEGECYVSSSTGNIPELLYLVETFKHRLMAGEYSE